MQISTSAGTVRSASLEIINDNVEAVLRERWGRPHTVDDELTWHRDGRTITARIMSEAAQVTVMCDDERVAQE